MPQDRLYLWRAPPSRVLRGIDVDMETLGGLATHSAPTRHPTRRSLRSASPNLPALGSAGQSPATPTRLGFTAVRGVGTAGQGRKTERGENHAILEADTDKLDAHASDAGSFIHPAHLAA